MELWATVVTYAGKNAHFGEADNTVYHGLHGNSHNILVVV